MKRRHTAVLAGLAALASLGLACRERTDATRAVASPLPADATVGPDDVSLVRVIHAIPGGAAADVYADDAKAFAGVEYKTVTAYAPIEDNQVTFKLQVAGQTGEPLAENRELLMHGSQYTVVAIPGERGKPAELKVLSDEKAQPGDDKAKVRVVNAASDSGDLEVVMDGKKDALVKDLEPADAGGYHDIEPVSGKILVRDKDRGRIIAEAQNATLSPGKAYTMLVVGRAVGQPAAEVIVLEDGKGTMLNRTPTSSR